MFDKIPQRDAEIIEQLAFSYAESVQKYTRNTLATIYKKGVIAERKALIDKVLEIIDGYKATEPTKLSASTHNILLDRMKHDVLALKGGEQE